MVQRFVHSHAFARSFFTSRRGTATDDAQLGSASLVRRPSTRSAKGLKILCFGDSITAGFHSGGRCYEPYGKTMSGELKKLGCDVTVFVNGLSGLTARDMAAKAGHQVIPDVTGKVGKGLNALLDGRPDLVIIMAGTNDLGMGMSPEAILADVCHLHKACHARGIPTVALPPSTVAQGPCTVVRQRLAAMLMDWATATPAVLACIDMMELIPHRGPSPLWDFDGLHLSATGSKTLGQRLSAKLKHLLDESALTSHCTRRSSLGS